MSKPDNCRAPNCSAGDIAEGRCCGWIESEEGVDGPTMADDSEAQARKAFRKWWHTGGLLAAPITASEKEAMEISWLAAWTARQSEANLAAAFRHLQTVSLEDNEPMSAAEWCAFALGAVS